MLISKSKLKNIIKKLILEAYVDPQGKLGDFDSSPYNMDISDDTSPFYDPSLPRRNRFKAPDGSVYLELIVTEEYQKDVLERALEIAKQGRNMPDLGGFQKLGDEDFEQEELGDKLKIKFRSKFQQLILKVLEEIRQKDLIKFKKMQYNDNMEEEEKKKQLKIFNSVFDILINSIK